MTRRINSLRSIGLIGTIVLAGSSARAQVEAPAQKQARAIEEVRALVADLEAQVEAQRAQLQKSEACLKLARALLVEMQPVPANKPTSQDQQRSSQLSAEEERALPEQALAEKTPWNWTEERSNPKASMRQLGEGYHLKVEPNRERPWSLNFSLSHEGQADYPWGGHEHTVFVRREDVLYRAEFRTGQSGCRIIAFDMKAAKPLWEHELYGISVPGHSQYSNRINLEIDDRHLTVLGHEAHGDYLELVDLATGQTVGHRVVPRSDRQP